MLNKRLGHNPFCVLQGGLSLSQHLLNYLLLPAKLYFYDLFSFLFPILSFLLCFSYSNQLDIRSKSAQKIVLFGPFFNLLLYTKSFMTFFFCRLPVEIVRQAKVLPAIYVLKVSPPRDTSTNTTKGNIPLCKKCQISPRQLQHKINPF